MVKCNVMDPSQHGDDFSAGLCCPAETPNLLLNNGGDYSEARCAFRNYHFSLSLRLLNSTNPEN